MLGVHTYATYTHGQQCALWRGRRGSVLHQQPFQWGYTPVLPPSFAIPAREKEGKISADRGDAKRQERGERE